MIMVMLIFLFAVLGFVFFIWLKADRSYQSSSSVASAYDDWTDDLLLERLWGEHIHLGFYRNHSELGDFRSAKEDFVHELVKWSGLDKLPPGSRVLDVGCGIGGSSRILAKEYGFDVLGISISSSQVRRAKELTRQGVSCSFQVMDAMNLQVPKGSFDAVWSVEAGPHMPDKQLYANELLRVLRPNGLLAVADWNSRDLNLVKLSFIERLVMGQLLRQWAHPQFASIADFRQNLIESPYALGLIQTDDWTSYTLPSWFESIFEGVRRPGAVFGLGPGAFLKGLREIPTILLMHWAFSNGLMQFGVFRLETNNID